MIFGKDRGLPRSVVFRSRVLRLRTGVSEHDAGRPSLLPGECADVGKEMAGDVRAAAMTTEEELGVGLSRKFGHRQAAERFGTSAKAFAKGLVTIAAAVAVCLDEPPENRFDRLSRSGCSNEHQGRLADDRVAARDIRGPGEHRYEGSHEEPDVGDVHAVGLTVVNRAEQLRMGISGGGELALGLRLGDLFGSVFLVRKGGDTADRLGPVADVVVPVTPPVAGPGERADFAGGRQTADIRIPVPHPKGIVGAFAPSGGSIEVVKMIDEGLGGLKDGAVDGNTRLAALGDLGEKGVDERGAAHVLGAPVVPFAGDQIGGLGGRNPVVLEGDDGRPKLPQRLDLLPLRRRLLFLVRRRVPVGHLLCDRPVRGSEDPPEAPDGLVSPRQFLVVEEIIGDRDRLHALGRLDEIGPAGVGIDTMSASRCWRGEKRCHQTGRKYRSA
jgi:hypothetical protein